MKKFASFLFLSKFSPQTSDPKSRAQLQISQSATGQFTSHLPKAIINFTHNYPSIKRRHKQATEVVKTMDEPVVIGVLALQVSSTVMQHYAYHSFTDHFFRATLLST